MADFFKNKFIPFFKKVFTAIKTFLSENKDELIKPTIVLLCICIIIPFALAATNKLTKGRIVKLEAKSNRETMLSLIKADEFKEEKFSSKKGEFTYNIALKDKNAIAFIFTTSAKGYGGEVKVMTAIDPSGKILDVAVLDVSNETPGLGQNAKNPEFYSQFKNKSGRISIKDVDTLTGATITSKAVTNAINKATESFALLEYEPNDNTSETEETTSEAK